jgi:hypothetical protein
MPIHVAFSAHYTCLRSPPLSGWREIFVYIFISTADKRSDEGQSSAVKWTSTSELVLLFFLRLVYVHATMKTESGLFLNRLPSECD